MEDVARIHKAGVELELAQIGHQLDLNYSSYWFEQMWDIQTCAIETHKINGKTVGFITSVGGEIMLYVDPDYHRQGIGNLLLGMEGAVWVLNGNKPAERFYTKNGYYNTKKSRLALMFGHEVTQNLWSKGEHETDK